MFRAFKFFRKFDLYLQDYILRIDNGLWEIENEYAKKNAKKKGKGKNVLILDRGYNQLQGKLTAALAIAQDFGIHIPETDRIIIRCEARKMKVKRIL